MQSKFQAGLSADPRLGEVGRHSFLAGTVVNSESTETLGRTCIDECINGDPGTEANLALKKRHIGRERLKANEGRRRSEKPLTKNELKCSDYFTCPWAASCRMAAEFFLDSLWELGLW